MNHLVFAPGDAPKTISWPVDGADVVSVRITDLIYHPGDCIDFVIEDDRSIRFAGEDVDFLAARLLWTLTPTVPFNMLLKGPPAFYPRAH
jgi:hypothetical protein